MHLHRRLYRFDAQSEMYEIGVLMKNLRFAIGGEGTVKEIYRPSRPVSLVLSATRNFDLESCTTVQCTIWHQLHRESSIMMSRNLQQRNCSRRNKETRSQMAQGRPDPPAPGSSLKRLVLDRTKPYLQHLCNGS